MEEDGEDQEGDGMKEGALKKSSPTYMNPCSMASAACPPRERSRSEPDGVD